MFAHTSQGPSGGAVELCANWAHHSLFAIGSGTLHRKEQSLPLYKREGSPYWQYSFTIGGVRFRGSTGKKGKREAALVEAETKSRARDTRQRDENWTLGMTLAAYWNEHGQHQVSADYIWTKIAAIERVMGGKTPLESITNSDLMDYRAARMKEGMEAHSVNRDLAQLKAAFNHANQMHGKQVPAIAWRKIKAKEPPARERFLSKEEFHTLLEFCQPEVALIVQFAVATGLRKSNVLNLDWQEVDLNSSLVTVKVKGNKLHTVRLTPPLRAALSSLPQRKGKVFDTTGFRKRFEKAVAKAGLENFRFHDLRHTCASWLRLAGVDIIDIKEILGHSSVAVTMRYAHIEPKHRSATLDRISADVWSQFESQSTKQEVEKKLKS